MVSILYRGVCFRTCNFSNCSSCRVVPMFPPSRLTSGLWSVPSWSLLLSVMGIRQMNHSILVRDLVADFPGYRFSYILHALFLFYLTHKKKSHLITVKSVAQSKIQHPFEIVFHSMSRYATLLDTVFLHNYVKGLSFS